MFSVLIVAAVLTQQPQCQGGVCAVAQSSPAPAVAQPAPLVAYAPVYQATASHSAPPRKRCLLGRVFGGRQCR